MAVFDVESREGRNNDYIQILELKPWPKSTQAAVVLFLGKRDRVHPSMEHTTPNQRYGVECATHYQLGPTTSVCPNFKIVIKWIN